MTNVEKFVTLQRSDGSKVACQLSRIIFFTKADHGSVLHFGGGTQLNVKEDYDDLLALVGAGGPKAS